jgi:diphthamide synthase (EF-2-diphthine--ammonia ligase)
MSLGMTNGRALVSFSGGKDSMLALHRAAEGGDGTYYFAVLDS